MTQEVISRHLQFGKTLKDPKTQKGLPMWPINKFTLISSESAAVSAARAEGVRAARDSIAKLRADVQADTGMKQARPYAPPPHRLRPH